MAKGILRASAVFVPAVLVMLGAGACGDESNDAPPAETPDAAPPVETSAPAPTASTPPPAEDAAVPDDMAHWQPPAKGLWIWYLDYVGMTADQAADKAKQVGVGYVLIKSGQEAKYWDTRYTPENVKAFTDRGLKVLAWPYVTPDDVEGEIDAVTTAANVPGTSGIVLDVEVEFEGSHAAEATQLCKGIRAKVPGVWLGYTSFGWVGLHGSFPWKAFDADCGDAYFPQVYYSDRGVTWNGDKGLTSALDQYKTMGLKAPLWPIQSNDDVYKTTTGPTDNDLNGFFDQAGTFSSLWEFPADGETTKLNQLANLHWKNP